MTRLIWKWKRPRPKPSVMLLTIYIVAYVPLSLSGSYRLTQSGQVRYGSGLSVTDLVQWSPGLARCQPFKTVSGSWSLRGNFLGYLFAPLVLADQQFLHRTTRLFDPATGEPISDWSAVGKTL